LSCRGLWPLYITCDVPVPYARSVDDMLTILDVIATEDPDTTGDFIREQTHIPISKPVPMEHHILKNPEKFKGKRIGVPKMYIGGEDSDPHAKHPYVSPEVIALWTSTENALQSLGAEIVHTNFPLITNYENDSQSGEANNVVGRPGNWNLLERGTLIAKAWDAFLVDNADPNISSLADIKDSSMLFPKPPNYLPDTFLEVRNWIDYPGLPDLMHDLRDKSIHEIDGMPQALTALEAQRKRDLEDWMDANHLDLVAFPAQGDVGLADLETEYESTKHSLTNGVKYSNGNRAIRHLGVPTVSVPMGAMSEKKMPVNITFAGEGYADHELLGYAWAFENAEKKRIAPPLDRLETDVVKARKGGGGESELEVTGSVKAGDEGAYTLMIQGEISGSTTQEIEIYVDGKLERTLKPKDGKLDTEISYKPTRPECLGWDLKPLPPRKAMVLVVTGRTSAKLLWIDYSGHCRS
jgi:Asp-tRNA(Asn)/Glu-tRNA(Gln) amidotransferase A subunit family amidase